MVGTQDQVERRLDLILKGIMSKYRENIFPLITRIPPSSFAKSMAGQVGGTRINNIFHIRVDWHYSRANSILFSLRIKNESSIIRMRV